MLENFIVSGWLIPIILIFSVWEIIWKGIALWKCGRNSQLAWFVVILIFNTLGILPIIYLIFFQKRPENMAPLKKPLKKKTKKKTTQKRKR